MLGFHRPGRWDVIDDVSLDIDWFYRKGARAFMWLAERPLARYEQAVREGLQKVSGTALVWSGYVGAALLVLALVAADVGGGAGGELRRQCAVGVAEVAEDRDRRARDARAQCRS